MKAFRGTLASVALVLALRCIVFAADLRVRVIASQANIRLKADLQSAIIARVPLGGVISVIQKEGDWYQIKLPPDENGIVVTGYIHASTVEIVEEITPPVQSAMRVEQPRAEEKNREIVQNLVEATKRNEADFLRWQTEYKKAEETFIKWKKYSKIGFFSLLGATVALPIIDLTMKENYLTPTFVAVGIGLGGAGLWLFSNGKRSGAKEKMDLLMNEGKIKRYFSAQINPRTKYYAITFNIGF